MQCKDIPDAEFLAACVAAARYPTLGVSRWDLAEYMNLPDKLVMAKAAKLIARGLLGGCVCGCRGDFLPRASST